MNIDLIQKLRYSFTGHNEVYSLPFPLQDSIRLMSAFFGQKYSNKLCLVFPSKEYTAQWLAVPTVLFLIEYNFMKYKDEIFESYRQYNLGDKLKLNGEAIVEWAGIRNDSVAFRAGKEPNTAVFTINKTQSIKLQRTEQSRKLSSINRVKQALPGKIITPTDKLLEINTYGNQEFIKNNICLVNKFKSYYDSIEGIAMNLFLLPEYFQCGKIDENGTADINSPLLITNNLSNLFLYSTHSSTSISKIIIDGFSHIMERSTDFLDIDANNISTILITDLSEIESFETIGNYGFEFFNFTKQNLRLDHPSDLSPFHSFEKKIKNYFAFSIVKEICYDEELETTVNKIHSIEKDESNNDLTTLNISLIQLTNLVSRVAHIMTEEETSILNSKINSIETLFLRCRIWLGDSQKPIEESISLLKSVIARFSTQPSEKCTLLKKLLSSKQYDYIICSTEEEAKALNDSFPVHSQKPGIISVADVNDKLLSSKPLKVILMGWVKANNINRILSSFLFSELTTIFYQFENKYYNSLQRRNKQYSENIKATINRIGIRSKTDSLKLTDFSDLYANEEVSKSTSESSFDILDFELRLENAQYSRYAANGNQIDSIKAKRIDFESDFFIYTNESHKFLLINELIERKGEKANIFRRKVELLQTGDVIAMINTDRDILVELVEKSTNTKELASVKKWTELWKKLLKEYYSSIGNDFRKLVEDLRKNECKKHEVTIRTWLLDENRIGPNDDADLISIALLANSQELLENISKVRDSISKMVGWRMQAADYVANRIKSQIHKLIDESLVNHKVEIEGLGSVTILKVIDISSHWKEIDIRYVNRLLQKEIL